jgi:tetratricopeptide (TPR) repeat protein
MIKYAILVVLTCSISSNVFATPYGNYDLHKIFKISKNAQGGHHTELNVAELAQMTADLSRHAENYPPQFDCDSDKMRAIRDIKTATDILAILKNGEPDIIMLMAAHLNALAHNFDIPFAAVEADAIYTQLTKEHPDDAHYAYFYGLFLESSNQLDKASIYLNQALSGGIFDANRSLGVLYLTKGDREKALGYLKTYHSKTPDDSQTASLIKDIEDGNVTYEHH